MEGQEWRVRIIPNTGRMHQQIPSKLLQTKCSHPTVSLNSLRQTAKQCTERKMVLFDLKLGSLAEQKFDLGFRIVGEYLAQIDSILGVNLAQIFSNYSHSRVEFKFHQVTQFLGQNDSIFRSKWLHF